MHTPGRHARSAAQEQAFHCVWRRATLRPRGSERVGSGCAAWVRKAKSKPRPRLARAPQRAEQHSNCLTAASSLPCLSCGRLFLVDHLTLVLTPNASGLELDAARCIARLPLRAA